MKTKHKILIAKIISKFLTSFMSKNQIVTRNGIKWNLNLEEGIDLSIYLFGTSEKKIFNLTKLLLKKDDLTIIDIGANIGSVSLVMAKIFNNSRIFSIEPTNYAYQKLCRNLDLNENLKKNISLRQLFITNDKKPKAVWSSWNFEKSNDKHEKHLGTLKEIKQNPYVKLNQFIKNEDISNVDFIKLDVDGYELEVLVSGEDFLKKNKPIIFIEIAPYLYPEFGYNCYELIKFIKKMNYEFFDEDTKKIVDIFSEVDKINDGSSKNYFLI